MPELRKGDKITITDGQVNTLPNMTEYFIIENLEEFGEGKLRMDLKFKYKSKELFREAKAKNKLKGNFGDDFFIRFHFSRREAFDMIRKYE